MREAELEMGRTLAFGAVCRLYCRGGIREELFTRFVRELGMMTADEVANYREAFADQLEETLYAEGRESAAAQIEACQTPPRADDARPETGPDAGGGTKRKGGR